MTDEAQGASEEHSGVDDVPMAERLASVARSAGIKRVAVRVQGEYLSVYERLITMGARVRWTDLRMTLKDFGESRAASGVVLSNWEI